MSGRRGQIASLEIYLAVDSLESTSRQLDSLIIAEPQSELARAAAQLRAIAKRRQLRKGGQISRQLKPPAREAIDILTYNAYAKAYSYHGPPR